MLLLLLWSQTMRLKFCIGERIWGWTLVLHKHKFKQGCHDNVLEFGGFPRERRLKVWKVPESSPGAENKIQNHFQIGHKSKDHKFTLKTIFTRLKNTATRSPVHSSYEKYYQALMVRNDEWKGNLEAKKAGSKAKNIEQCTVLKKYQNSSSTKSKISKTSTSESCNAKCPLLEDRCMHCWTPASCSENTRCNEKAHSLDELMNMKHM